MGFLWTGGRGTEREEVKIGKNTDRKQGDGEKGNQALPVKTVI